MGSIILAGGRSSRLGQDKMSLIISGEHLLDRIVSKLEQLHGEIILVLAAGQAKPATSYLSQVKITTDLYPGKGPLIGIYSGLQATDDDKCIAVGCDMPFLNVDLLRYMMGLAPEFDVVVPSLDGMVEPLHAVYSKGCLASIERLLKQGYLSVSRLFSLVRVRYVEADEIDRFDPKHLSFFNINTEADLKVARKLAKGDNIN